MNQEQKKLNAVNTLTYFVDNGERRSKEITSKPSYHHSGCYLKNVGAKFVT